MRRFIGKFVGTVLGFAFAGVAGAFIGLIIGHLNDIQSGALQHKRARLKDDIFPDFPMEQEQKSILALGIIILGAKLAKVDGPVTREEVLAFRRVFRSPESRLDEVGNLFDRARKSSDGYEPYAARMAHVFGPKSAILQEVLTGLFLIAISDSQRLSRSEILFLRRVGGLFGFTEDEFTRLAQRAGISLSKGHPPAPKQSTAYDVLGLPTTATDEVIKRTYHALIRKHHPDKLLAAGLPAERIEQATEKMKTINAAYAEICKMRQMK